MGQSSSVIYSVELPQQEQPKNSTKVRRHPDFINGLIDSPDQKLKTLQQILIQSFNKYSKNDCIGWVETKSGSQEKKIIYKKYFQIQQRIDILQRAIQDLNLSPIVQEVAGLRLKFIGIFSKTRSQWLQVDTLTILKGYCIVPIYDTLGVQNIPYILNHTNMTTLFCSRPSLDILQKCQNLGAIKNIVCFDNVEEQCRAKFQEKSIKIYEYNDLISKYEKISINIQPRNLKPNDVVAFCYTSGTTGPPKGAMLSQKNFAAYIAALRTNKQLNFTQRDTHISYLPLAHLMENISVLAILVSGGRICPFGGDIKNIKNDIALVKPTFFVSVPRLYNRFYDAVNQKFKQTTGCKKLLVNNALQTKTFNAQHYASWTHVVWDKIIFNKTKQLFGGNCRLMLSGSAPLKPQVHSFMKVIGCAPLLEAYGQTESTGASFVSSSSDKTVGHVGGPTSMVQYKLQDIPQMNYTHLDKDQNNHHTPRGEVLIRGPGVFLGYYKDSVKTNQAIDSQGWLHTGDVGVIVYQTKALKLIDRKKNIFKLQQGQYVASERVQSVYTKRFDMVSQMFLYGDSTQNYCVVIISPVRKCIQQIAKTNNIQGQYQDFCKNKLIKTQYLKELNKFSKKQGLNGFQQPKNIYLEPLTFQQKGILTTTMKLQRYAAKNVYATQIKQMYDQGMLDK